MEGDSTLITLSVLPFKKPESPVLVKIRTWWMMGLKNPVCLVGVSDDTAAPSDLHMSGDLVKLGRSREALHVELGLCCHFC